MLGGVPQILSLIVSIFSLTGLLFWGSISKALQKSTAHV